LFWSAEGRSVRRQIESSFEGMLSELGSFQGTISRAAAAATEGMKLLDEFSGALGEGRTPAASRYGGTH
jgi:hypothetical protein